MLGFSALFVGRVLGAAESRDILTAGELPVSVPYSLGAFLGRHGEADLRHSPQGFQCPIRWARSWGSVLHSLLCGAESEVSVPYSLGAFLGRVPVIAIRRLLVSVSVPYSLGAFLGHGCVRNSQYDRVCFSALFVGRVLGAIQCCDRSLSL